MTAPTEGEDRGRRTLGWTEAEARRTAIAKLDARDRHSRWRQVLVTAHERPHTIGDQLQRAAAENA